MHSPTASHKSDELLLHDLRQLIAGECRNTALIVEHIAEADRRKLHLREGFPSMFVYCVDGLHLSESAAYKRIHAARAARKYPEILAALADGRVHLSAICLIAPYLTRRTGPELLAAATHRRRFEITELLARRFPQPDRLAADPGIRRLPPAPPSLTSSSLAPGAAGMATLPGRPSETILVAPPQDAEGPVPGQSVVPEAAPEGAPEGLAASSPGGVAPGAVPQRLELAAAGVAATSVGASSAPSRSMVEATPLSAERFELRFIVDQETHELLKRAQELLRHAVPSGSIPEVFRRSLVALISQTEKRIAGAGGSRSRRRVERPSTRRRYIPAPIRRAVWERDGGRCTFESKSGRRCESREFLEFDHADPVARGGRASVEGIRLRCRAHNQYEAERAFGSEFMERKRQEAQRKRAEGKVTAGSADRKDLSRPKRQSDSKHPSGTERLSGHKHRSDPKGRSDPKARSE